MRVLVWDLPLRVFTVLADGRWLVGALITVQLGG